MHVEQRFLVYLFNDKSDSANAPYIVKAPDVNFVTDINSYWDLQIRLPLLVPSLLISPYGLESFVATFLDELGEHLVDGKARHQRLVSNDVCLCCLQSRILILRAIKVTHKTRLQKHHHQQQLLQTNPDLPS